MEVGGGDVAADASAGAVFTVRCLGRFEVSMVDGERVAGWKHQKAPELLALLLVHPGETMARQTIAERLWPDVPWDDSVSHALSNVASQLRIGLRRASGQPALPALAAAWRNGYRLRPEYFRVDVDAFDAALRRAASAPAPEALPAYEEACALYRGDFLEDEEFAWAEPIRSALRQRLMEALHRAATIAARTGDRERAAGFYKQILERDPTDEAAVRARMQALADSGDVNAARKTYRALCDALQLELGDPEAGPAAETRALLATLTEEARNA